METIKLELDKITQKQLSGYYKSESGNLGISFNDNYNKVHYGITMAENRFIGGVLVSLTGNRLTKLPLTLINRYLQGEKVLGACR